MGRWKYIIVALHVSRRCSLLGMWSPPMGDSEVQGPPWAARLTILENLQVSDAWGWSPRSSAVVELLRPHRGRLLVDVGCGQGKDAPLSAEGFDRYVGVDHECRPSWRAAVRRSGLPPGRCRAPADSLGRCGRRDGALARRTPPLASRVLPRGRTNPPSGRRDDHVDPEPPELLRVCHEPAPSCRETGLKRFLFGEDEEHATYYRCNTLRAIDSFAAPLGLVRRNVRMLIFPGYTFRFPLGARWFEVERRVMERLPAIRTGIAAAYEKTHAGFRVAKSRPISDSIRKSDLGNTGLFVMCSSCLPPAFRSSHAANLYDTAIRTVTSDEGHQRAFAFCAQSLRSVPCYAEIETGDSLSKVVTSCLVRSNARNLSSLDASWVQALRIHEGTLPDGGSTSSHG